MSIVLAMVLAAAPFEPVLKTHAFVGEVLIADGSKVIFNTGKRPLWPWGSVSKQVTAALVMQQVAAGTLSLETKASEVLTGFPHSVSVRQLLQHTSGLRTTDDAFHGTQVADVLAYCGAPVRGPPGTFEYNNCDTLVLAAMLEKVSGMSFKTLLEKRVTSPLKLTSVHLAKPHERPVKAHSSEPLPTIDIATYGAGGALVGSSRDLLAFDRALIAHSLLDAPSTEVMWKGEPSLGYVALGAWSFPASLASCKSPVRLIERRGSVDGVQTRNIIAPDLGRVLILFTDDADFDFGEIWQGKGLSYDLTSAAFCR